MTKLRAVLDTYVVISSLFWSGPPFEIAVLGLKGAIQLVPSSAIVNEVERKLKSKFSVPEVRIAILVGAFINHSELVSPDFKLNVSRDPDDNKVLECALAGSADYIVTGDRHLLDIREFKGVRIVPPAEFLAIVRSKCD